MEYITAAAIWVGLSPKKGKFLPWNLDRGHVEVAPRHHLCFSKLKDIFYPDFVTNENDNRIRLKLLRSKKQGFMTSTGRFLDRKEAKKVAIAAKQLIKDIQMAEGLDSSELW